jgi:hypothetical protein
MEKVRVQNLQNHARFFPPFHFVVMPIVLINFIARLVLLKSGITADSILNVLVGFALIMLALSARLMALTVQDRVIRLEMQLRLQSLLPELRSRLDEFTTGQLIALRFASDQELPTLARQVLDEKLTDRKAIKARVKNWRSDFLRA